MKHDLPKNTTRTRLWVALALSLGSTAPVWAADCPTGTESTIACTQLKAAAAGSDTKALEARLATLAQASAEERRARDIIERFLDLLPLPTADSPGFELQRDYTISNNAGVFQTTFTNVVFGGGGGKAELGDFNITIQPQADGKSKLALKLGNAFTVKEGDKLVAKLNLGEQALTGTWDESLRTFAESELKLGKLVLELPQAPNSKAELGQVQAKQVLVRGTDGTWKQDSIMQLSGLKVLAEGTPVSLGKITGTMNLGGTNYDKLISLTETLSSKLEHAQSAPPDQQEALGLEAMKQVAELYQLFSNFDSRLTFADFSVGDAKQSLFKLSELRFDSRFAPTSTGTSQFSYSVEINGLKTDPKQLQAMGIPAAVIPSAARLEFGLNDIPANVIAQVMDIVQNGGKDAKTPEESEALIQQKLLALVNDSKMSLFVKDSHVTAKDTRLLLDANAQLNTQSPLMGVGKLNVRIENLQKFIDTLGPLAKDESVAQVFAMMMMFSNRVEEKGKVVDNYEFSASADGQMLLNGKDISQMMAAGGSDANAGSDASADEDECAEGEDCSAEEEEGDTPKQTAK